MRFELTTLTLARLCSTPELRPHSNPGPALGGTAMGAYMPNRNDNCNPYFHPSPPHPCQDGKQPIALGFCTGARLGVRLVANIGAQPKGQ